MPFSYFLAFAIRAPSESHLLLLVAVGFGQTAQNSGDILLTTADTSLHRNGLFRLLRRLWRRPRGLREDMSLERIMPET